MTKFEKIRIAQPPKARLMLWADLNHSDMEMIEKSKSTSEIERVLSHALLSSYESQAKKKVLLELYTNLVLFCREQNFNREQTSVLISIMKNVHQFGTETPLNNTDQCLSYCSELLLCHSVKRPPFSVDLFSSEQVRLDIHFSYGGIEEDTDTEEPPPSDCTGDEARKVEEEREIEEVPQSSEVADLETRETDSLKSDSSKPELRALVEKEVKEEVMRLTAQLHQRLQDSTDQLNQAIAKLESNIQVKK